MVKCLGLTKGDTHINPFHVATAELKPISHNKTEETTNNGTIRKMRFL
jgi:hypothetical protein